MLSSVILLLMGLRMTLSVACSHPAIDTCLCVAGTRVNARASASLSAPIRAVLNTGDCFKFDGDINTNDGYTWYQLQNVKGSENLWVANNFLNIASPSQCTCSAAIKNYACQILKLHNDKKITLWNRHPSGVRDNAYALHNILDTCNGLKASRSQYTCNECPSPGAPGGNVCLNEQLLKYILEIGSTGFVHVNEIAGACHSCTSKHYQGKAVDLDPGNRKTDFINKCRNFGGWALDERSHIHCDFRYHK